MGLVVVVALTIAQAGPPFDDAEAESLMTRLERYAIGGEEPDTLAAIVAAGDTRFTSVLIELVRATEMGLFPHDAHEPFLEGLQQLTGQQLVDWPDWVEWYASTELEPPPGFQAWKGRLLGAIDPGFAAFFGDHPSTIRVEEVVWGGVSTDGIPPLDSPRHLAAVDAGYLSDSDLVFGVSVGGDHRAYPLRIMDSHEMANDVVGGVPVSLAYCTLCGAGILYEGRLGGHIYTFGSSGLLMRSNKLMYDRTSMTLWNQLTGEPVLGLLAGRDLTLRRLPVVVTTWSDWLAAHPDTVALDIDTGFERDYGSGAAYGEYYASPDPLFPVGVRSDLLGPKDRVFALLLDGVPVAYPVDALAAERVINDSVGGTPVVLLALHGTLRGQGSEFVTGLEVEWRAGAEVRAFEAGSHTFSASNGVVVDERAVPWQVREEVLVSDRGETLPRLPGHLSYWFAWFSYFPRTLVYGFG